MQLKIIYWKEEGDFYLYGKRARNVRKATVERENLNDTNALGHKARQFYVQ